MSPTANVTCGKYLSMSLLKLKFDQLYCFRIASLLSNVIGHRLTNIQYFRTGTENNWYFKLFIDFWDPVCLPPILFHNPILWQKGWCLQKLNLKNRLQLFCFATPFSPCFEVISKPNYKDLSFESVKSGLVPYQLRIIVCCFIPLVLSNKHLSKVKQSKVIKL